MRGPNFWPPHPEFWGIRVTCSLAVPNHWLWTWTIFFKRVPRQMNSIRSQQLWAFAVLVSVLEPDYINMGEFTLLDSCTRELVAFLSFESQSPDWQCCSEKEICSRENVFNMKILSRWLSDWLLKSLFDRLRWLGTKDPWLFACPKGKSVGSV